MNLSEIEQRLNQLENSIAGLGYGINNVLTSESQRQSRQQTPNFNAFGMYIALCVATDDPFNTGRIKIYHPVFFGPDGSLDQPPPLPEQLPWAQPISSMGGFDDSGSTWVPPAGSKVAIVFQNGNTDDPYYLGTVWDRHRGPNGQHIPFNFNYPYSIEYNELYEGRRNGYNFGDNNGDQVYPPWNTDSYRAYDWDDSESFYENLNERSTTSTYPHFYGLKTNGKQWLKFVDGDPKCNLKGKRTELATPRGNILVLKDDHLHPYSQFGYIPNATWCDTLYPCCEDGSSFTRLETGVNCNVQAFSGCSPQNINTSQQINRNDIPTNKFQKRVEELKFYRGVNTPSQYKVDLPQSGVYLGSVAGNFVKFDDSVDQPSGVPSWEYDFNYGCNNLYRGNITIGESTGHFIKLDGSEINPNIRGSSNGIIGTTAGGNYFSLSDHTEQVGETCESPPNYCGDFNGIELGTSSRHQFIMSNKGLKDCNSSRRYDPKSSLGQEGYEGYISLRSGYGLQLLMSDSYRQDNTDQQFIVLQAPQKDNQERGPHVLIMQEQSGVSANQTTAEQRQEAINNFIESEDRDTVSSGTPGYVFLRAGGVLYLGSYDETVEVVGTEESPKSKFSSITDSYFVQIKNNYFNKNKRTILWSDEVVFILAGEDCEPPEDPNEVTQQDNQNLQNASTLTEDGLQVNRPEKVPCVYNVITSKDPFVCPYTNYIHFGTYLDGEGNTVLDSRSNRVFASAENSEEEETE